MVGTQGLHSTLEDRGQGLQDGAKRLVAALLVIVIHNMLCLLLVVESFWSWLVNVAVWRPQG